MNDKPDRMPNVPPFVKFVASAVPMVFDNSLSYYEALCALWKYIQGMTDVINNNATLEEEYIEKFNELKTFVDEYFDNLDVQEEINNKLDQMVEDGTLQEIVAEYLNATALWGFDTVADMKSSTNLINGSFAKTLGYHAKNDFGGAVYKIRTIDVSDVVDEASLIEISATLVAELVNNGKELNVKCFGAYGDDSHDDTAALQACIDYAYASKIKVINLPEGIYRISEPLEVYENKIYNFNFEEVNTRQKGFPPSQLTFRGSETNNTMIKCTAGNYIFNGYATTPKGFQDLTFENILFNGNSVAKSVIQMDIEHFGGLWITFKNCRFNLFTEAAIQHIVTEAKVVAAPLGNCIKLVIDSCYITNNANGLIVGGDDTIIRNCTIQDNTSWGIIVKGDIHKYIIEDCKIQYNGTGKTLFAGGQILTQCSGDELVLNNNYFEPKTSQSTGNDTGFMVFDHNDLGTSVLLNGVTLTNNYFNGHRCPTCFNRIGNVRVNGFNVRSNRFFNMYSASATPYLITTSDAVLTSGGFLDNIQLVSNNITFLSSGGAHRSYLIINEVGTAPDAPGNCGGAVDTNRGVWTPNMVNSGLYHEMPTIIAGDFNNTGSTAMRSVGDFTVTKDTDTTGLFHVTFSRPISTYGYNGDKYPVLVKSESTSISADAYVVAKSASGFDVKTGIWNEAHDSFTPTYLSFGFIAVFLTNW